LFALLLFLVIASIPAAAYNVRTYDIPTLIGYGNNVTSDERAYLIANGYQLTSHQEPIYTYIPGYWENIWTTADPIWSWVAASVEITGYNTVYTWVKSSSLNTSDLSSASDFNWWLWFYQLISKLLTTDLFAVILGFFIIVAVLYFIVREIKHLDSGYEFVKPEKKKKFVFDPWRSACSREGNCEKLFDSPYSKKRGRKK
jgi:hypothetical protein